MFTVCPKCTLTLVVTTVDLRAGQGYVRCGRCANVFNALIALREGDPAGNISDTANRRLQETAPRPPAEPALGSGVAMDPEPEPEPAPEPEAGPAVEPEPESQPQYPESGLEADSLLEPESTLEPEATPEPEALLEPDAESAPGPEPSLGEEGSLEFDAISTDVSEIFIAPPGSEHDTGSGSYETVVLGEEAPAQPEPEPEPEIEPVADDPSHTDTIASESSDWSLLDDDDPPADDESVIEESPLAATESASGSEAEFESESVELTFEEPVEEFAEASLEEPAAEPPAYEDDQTTEQQADPAWVQEMFAEAEATAERARPAAYHAAEETDEDAVVQAARASTGAAAPSDTVLEPLLAVPAPAGPRWPVVAGVAVLALLLLVQIVHANRQSLVLSQSVGPLLSRIYGAMNATLVPRWDLTAYNVKQMGAQAEGGEGNRLRVRLSVQNESTRVQPLPLLRLTLLDVYGKPVATRDLEPREYLPPAARDQRLLEPDQRIDAELDVIDPGHAAIGFEIDACLRAEGGSIGCANDARRRAPPG